MGSNVDGDSYIEASEKASNAMQVVATINTAAATLIAIRQLTLAEKYYALAKEAREYWKNTFKPLEVSVVNEVSQMPLYTPQYDVTAGRFVAAVKQQFKYTLDSIGKHASRYCTGLTATLLRDAMVAQSAAEGDVINLAYRYEDGRKQIFDEIRHSRRVQMSSLGRDIMNAANTYASQAFSAYGQLRDWTTGNASNAYNQMYAMRTVRDSPYKVSSVVYDQSRSMSQAGVIPNYNPNSGAVNGTQATAYSNTFTSSGTTFATWSGFGTPHNIAGADVAPGSPNGSYPYQSLG